MICMKKIQIKFKSKVWQYPGMSGWYFVNLPKVESGKIKENKKISKRGWGSVKVKASIGKTSWESSIFPDKKSGTYLLPLKKEVRNKEGIQDADFVSVQIVCV